VHPPRLIVLNARIREWLRIYNPRGVAITGAGTWRLAIMAIWNNHLSWRLDHYTMASSGNKVAGKKPADRHQHSKRRTHRGERAWIDHG